MNSIPVELRWEIFSFLGGTDLLQSCLVSRDFIPILIWEKKWNLIQSGVYPSLLQTKTKKEKNFFETSWKGCYFSYCKFRPYYRIDESSTTFFDTYGCLLRAARQGNLLMFQYFLDAMLAER